MARILSCAAAIVSFIALVTLRPNFVPAPGGRTATAPKSNVMGNPKAQFSAWNEKGTTEVQSKADGQDRTGQDDLWDYGPTKGGHMMDIWTWNFFGCDFFVS